MAAGRNLHRHKVLILGPGRVGSLMSLSGNYKLHLSGCEPGEAARLIDELQLANVTPRIRLWRGMGDISLPVHGEIVIHQ
jgi:hypothetical protein